VSPLRAGQRQQPAVLVTPIQEVGKRTGVSTTDVRAGIGIGEAGDPMYTLQAAAQHGVLTFAERGRADGRSVEVRADGTVNAIMTPNGGRSGTGAGDAVLAFHHTQDPISGDVSPAIGRQTDGMGVLAYAIGSHAGAADGDQTNRSHAGGGPVGMGISLELSHSLRAGRAQTVCTTGPVTHAPTHDGADASEDGTGRGKPIVARMVPFGEYATDGTASTIKQRDYKDATDLVVGARPRRLTPLECERLMSWPDEWTRYGRKEDGAVYELSDTARYRLCGNGVGSVCVQWIAERLARGVPC
jgi:DNA (cytosine-5)-methyltransferase 1